jgi:hypothetical protein
MGISSLLGETISLAGDRAMIAEFGADLWNQRCGIGTIGYREGGWETVLVQTGLPA